MCSGTKRGVRKLWLHYASFYFLLDCFVILRFAFCLSLFCFLQLNSRSFLERRGLGGRKGGKKSKRKMMTSSSAWHEIPSPLKTSKRNATSPNCASTSAGRCHVSWPVPRYYFPLTAYIYSMFLFFPFLFLI